MARTRYGDRAICERCDLEIEFIGNRRWHDRGGNTHCLDRASDSYKYRHRPTKPVTSLAGYLAIGRGFVPAGRRVP
jgi:hypothetical protein